MPKKTKREKLHADMHRTSIMISPEPSFQFRAQEPIPAAVAASHQASSEDLTRIKKDLLKTVALASMAIFSEVLLARIVR